MLQKRTLLILSFITGFSVMVIELTAARVIAPILGSSIYTWTSIIGVILLGTAIGNGVGGRLIDNSNRRTTIANFLLAAGTYVLFISPLANISTDLILKIPTLWLSTVIASALFFFTPAFLLGAVYPMIAKQSLQNIQSVGQDAGNLSFYWTAGSIVGTFLTGFVFIGYIGSAGTFLVISSTLILCSLWAYESRKAIVYGIIFYTIIVILYLAIKKNTQIDISTIFQKDSNYYAIKVAEQKLPAFGKVRILFLDAGSHSIESLSNENFDSYANIYPAFSIFNKKINDIAVLGGGSLELSDKFKNYYPNSNVTTAEIDPEVTIAAKKYFGASDYTINNTVPSDGRMFLAQSPKKYDVIFSDAYNSFISVPWHLTTKEFFQMTKTRLNSNGMFAINFLSAQTGNSSEFYKSMVATFSSVFENYYTFTYGNNSSQTENIVLVGINSSDHPANNTVKLQLLEGPGGLMLARHLATTDNANNAKNNSDPIIFTDNFAPTDRLMMPSINSYFQPYIKLLHPST